MKKAQRFFVDFYNQTWGRFFKKKKILVGNQIIKINTKPELNTKLIKEVFPNGLPEDHVLSSYL